MNDDEVDPGTRDDDASLTDERCEPGEVERDDALLDALAAGDRPASEDPLLALLSDWRAEVGAAPLPGLPSAEEIEIALAPNVSRLWPRRGWAKSHEHHHGQRPALWQAVTGAAAVAAVIVGGCPSPRTARCRVTPCGGSPRRSSPIAPARWSWSAT